MSHVGYIKPTHRLGSHCALDPIAPRASTSLPVGRSRAGSRPSGRRLVRLDVAAQALAHRAQVDRARRRGEPRVDPEALKQRVGLQNSVLITIGFVAMTAIGSIADATMGAASA